MLADVPVSLPAMVRAQKLQKRAGSVGFDFANLPDGMAKVREELAEVEAEIRLGNNEALAEELGDLLFSVVNVCRLAGRDAETLLRHTNDKFTNRFQRMADQLEQQGLALEDASLSEMDAAWNLIKR